MSEMMKAPDGWEEVLISEIADVFGGGTPDRSNDEFWDNGSISWATPTDITAISNSNYLENTKEKITEKGLSGSSAKILPIDSILLTSRATIGERKISKIPVCTNQGFTSLVSKNDNEVFLYYLLDKYIAYMYSRAYGTTFPEISRTEVKNIKVVLPKEKKEQEKIAKIISTLDRAIESTNRLIEKEKNIKTALMQELLTNGIDKNGQIRSSATHTYKPRELGLIPDEWEVVSLDKCISNNGDYGINAPAVDFSYALPTYLRITDIDEDGHFIDCDKKSVDDLESTNYFLNDGDIVFARTGNTTGKTYLYNPKDGKLVFAGFLIRFTPNKKKLIPQYLKAVTETSSYWAWVETNSARTGQPGINANEYKSFKFVLPPIEEQKQIAKILTTQDKKIQTEETTLAKLKELKKGVMNDLLSGKVRVKV